MNPEVAAYFDKHEGEVRAVALALRDAVSAAAPDADVHLAWGFPCWRGNERFVTIIAHAAHCNLQLWSGNRLAERWPDRIEGTGKQIRHVKVRTVGEIDDELSAIIDAAVELDRTAPQKVR